MPPGGLRPPWAAWGPGAYAGRISLARSEHHAATVTLALTFANGKITPSLGVGSVPLPLAKPPSSLRYRRPRPDV